MAGRQRIAKIGCQVSYKTENPSGALTACRVTFTLSTVVACEGPSMAITDSLLTALEMWRGGREQDRSQIVAYLRKISEACLQFRDTLEKLEKNEETNVWVLQEKTTQIGEYYKNISSVFGGRISSELLDELAVYLSRMCIADNTTLTTIVDELDSRSKAAFSVSRNYQVEIAPSASHDGPRIIVDIHGDAAQTFDGCLLELSNLSAQINALADGIEAGANYR